MSLIQRVSAAMERIASLKLADTTWDNVGVLVENPKPNQKNRVMLTIDLTPAVLAECVAKNVEVIVAYHPPIFTGLKRLTLRSPKQEIVLTTIAEGMSIFSPHTSLDAAPGGMNDWLVSILDPSATHVAPITPSDPTTIDSKVTNPSLAGMGRMMKFATPLELRCVVDRVKAGLGIPTVRVALPAGWSGTNVCSSAAVCAGSGTSVFRALKKPVDILLSGEMSHHDVLAALDNGQAVILCEHTNTERGFLRNILSSRLLAELGNGVDVLVSESDADPLVVW